MAQLSSTSNSTSLRRSWYVRPGMPANAVPRRKTALVLSCGAIGLGYCLFLLVLSRPAAPNLDPWSRSAQIPKSIRVDDWIDTVEDELEDLKRNPPVDTVISLPDQEEKFMVEEDQGMGGGVGGDDPGSKKGPLPEPILATNKIPALNEDAYDFTDGKLDVGSPADKSGSANDFLLTTVTSDSPKTQQVHKKEKVSIGVLDDVQVVAAAVDEMEKAPTPRVPLPSSSLNSFPEETATPSLACTKLGDFRECMEADIIPSPALLGDDAVIEDYDFELVPNVNENNTTLRGESLFTNKTRHLSGSYGVTPSAEVAGLKDKHGRVTDLFIAYSLEASRNHSTAIFDVVVAIDIMHPHLEEILLVANQIVNQTKDTDRIAVITFASKPVLRKPLHYGAETLLNETMHHISQLKPRWKDSSFDRDLTIAAVIEKGSQLLMTSNDTVADGVDDEEEASKRESVVVVLSSFNHLADYSNTEGEMEAAAGEGVRVTLMDFERGDDNSRVQKTSLKDSVKSIAGDSYIFVPHGKASALVRELYENFNAFFLPIVSNTVVSFSMPEGYTMDTLYDSQGGVKNLPPRIRTQNEMREIKSMFAYERTMLRGFVHFTAKNSKSLVKPEDFTPVMRVSSTNVNNTEHKDAYDMSSQWSLYTSEADFSPIIKELLALSEFRNLVRDIAVRKGGVTARPHASVGDSWSNLVQRQVASLSGVLSKLKQLAAIDPRVASEVETINESLLKVDL